MANLNLSEFTEKLFVADADHTFIWDTAASISKKVSRNSWLNSGTLTSNAPVTISQTWNNAAVAFTGLKVNAVSTASASGSLLFDLQVGGVSQFKVDKSGVATLSADGVPQLRMISVIGSGSVFNGLTLETSISTMAGFLVNRSTGEIKIGGLSTGGFFPTFYSNNAEAMRITPAGNVGIGTTAPGAKLQVGTHSGTVPSGSVVAIAGAVPRLSFSSNDDSLNYGGYILSNYAAGTFMTLGTRDSNADTAALTLKGGNVGIGTTSPTSKLHVAGELGTNITTFDSGAAVKITNTTATGKSWLLTSGIVNIHNEFFCIRQESISQPALIIAPTTNNVGVGINSPPSKLTVASGDIEVSTSASGLILKSPDGTRYRITVPNGGASLTITAV